MALDPISMTVAASVLAASASSRTKPVKPWTEDAPHVTFPLESFSKSVSKFDVATNATAKSEASGFIHPTLAKLDLMAKVEGAHAAAAVDAIKFFQSLPGGVPLPKVLPSDTGMVTLLWREGSHYAEVELEGNGAYYVYCRSYPEHNDEAAEGVPITDELHATAIAVLSRLAPKHLLLPVAQAA